MHFSGLALIGSEFVATSGRQVATSTDGVNWTRHETLTGRWILDLAISTDDTGAPVVVLVGDDGQVQEAPLDRSCEALEPPPVPEVPVFADGFESGTTNAWQSPKPVSSSLVPPSHPHLLPFSLTDTLLAVLQANSSRGSP